MMPAMTNLERRQTPRTPILGHAYINIEPNNGGIVLNVSDEGLCFHSFDPVQRNGKIRFWFSDHKQRIEANGTLAWTDETQKGGLRFTALPAEAREQIRNWMRQPATVLATGDGSEDRPPHAFPPPSSKPQHTKVVSTAAPPLAAVSPKLAAITQARPVPGQSSGFSRGLLTGLLISAVVAAAFLFHSYRREFGESLIRLGERFAAKSQAQTPIIAAASPPASSPAVLPGPPTSHAVSSAVVPTPVPAPAKAPPQPEKFVIRSEEPKVQPAPPVVQPVTDVARPEEAKLEPARPAAPAPASAAGDPAPGVATTVSTPSISVPSASPTSPATSSPLAAPSLPATGAATNADPIPAKLSPPPKFGSANPTGVETDTSSAENTALTSELYFDVGRFKNQSQAHIEMDKLSQLGFPASAVQKGFLWANSYHVLVGPYGDEERAKSTHQNLVSNGFKPRAFEKGSRAFTLNFPVRLNTARAPAGEYLISWESYLDDASVTFLHNDSVIATANGRWVKRDVKYPRDAYVYRRNGDGSRTLLEVRFGGTRQALVFGNS